MTSTNLAQSDIDALVARYGLGPHSIGGMFAETWQAEQYNTTGRAIASSIMMLLRPDDHPRWHTVDAEEIWTHCSGSDVVMSLVDEEGTGELVTVVLSSRPGGEPQTVVPAGVWQSARPVDGAALISCTTCPGFEPEGYRPAPVGWNPPGVPQP
jgi:uncharacterized protein